MSRAVALHYCFKCGVRIAPGEREFVESPETGRHAHQTCPTVVWVPGLGSTQPLRMSPTPCHTLEGAQEACERRLRGTTLRVVTGWHEDFTKIEMDFPAALVRDLEDMHQPGAVVGYQTIEAFRVLP